MTRQSILADFTAAVDRRVQLAGARVLDVGSGDGTFARQLARAGAHVIGVECASAQLALCRRATGVADERYVYGVGQALPFKDGSFDATVFRASLHHVPGDVMVQALREARRVTRKGGEIFVFEPLTTGTHFRLTRLVDDETVVRGLAQDAIARAIVEGWLVRTHAATLDSETEYASLDALREHMVAIDAGRAALFDAVTDDLRRVFDHDGAPTDGGGRRFTQPFRLDVLR